MDASRITGTNFTQQTPLTGTPAKIGTEKTEVPGDQVQLGSGQSTEVAPKKWLIMNYVAADCNLTEFQLGNIDQMELVGSDKNTHIVALVDVGPKAAPIPLGKGEAAGVSKEAVQIPITSGEGAESKPTPEPGPPPPGTWSGSRTLYITKDEERGRLNSQVLEQHSDHIDMSNPETLKKFVVDTVKKFPAENVALIFNDHGGGFTGAMSDDTDGNFMSIPQMKQALTEAMAETGKKLDIIGFDACLMAETEVAHSFKDVANIMLAAEESEGGTGWTYNQMLDEKKPAEHGMLIGRTLGEALQRTQEQMLYKLDVTPEQFAKTVVDVNAAHSEDIPTFSAVNLGKMDQLKGSIDELADAIIETKEKDVVKGAIEGAENYGGGWSPYGDIRDLGHVCSNIIEKTSDPKLKDAAEGVRKSLGEAVMYNEVNPQQHPKSEGLTIYAPTEGGFGKDYAEIDFAKESKWDEAIESLGVKFDETKRGPEVWPDGSPRKPKPE